MTFSRFGLRPARIGTGLQGGRALLLCLLLLGSLVSLRAERDPDVGYSESTVLTLAGPGRPSLQSRVEVEQVFLSKRSTERTVFSVTEDYFARIQNLSGRVRGDKLKSGSISHQFPQRRDIFLSSEQVHRLEFPSDLKPGESISFSYEQQFQDVAFTPVFHVPNLDVVRRFEVIVQHPADVLVDFDLYFPGAKLEPNILRPTPLSTILRFQNLPYQDTLSHFAYRGIQALILPRFKREGALLNPATPERFAEWYLKLLESPGLPAPTLPEALQGPLAKAVGDRQKVQILFDFVKEHIRYAADELAANAITPRNPGYVLKNGFGDCKDKAFLLHHLARLLGLKVDLVLVFANQVPGSLGLSVGTFNHMICHFEDKEGPVFMDPTSRDVVFGNLPMGDIHRGALVLDPAKPRLVRLPLQRRLPSILLEITGTLEAPGKASARVVLHNEYLALAARAKRELRALDLENKLSNSINQRLYKISLDHFTLERETPDSMEFKATANLEDFLVTSPTRTYLPQAPFKTHEAELLKRLEDPHPIDVDLWPWIQLRIDIEGDGMQTKVEQVHLGDPSMERFEASSGPGPKGARFSYETCPAEDYFTGEAKTRYLDFFSKYLLQRRHLFAITRSQP